MAKDLKPFLTDRQVEILRLRKQGLTQEEVATLLKTTRENVSILEKRVYENIKRAKATLDLLDELKMSVQVIIPPKTLLRDVHKIVLAKADEMNIHMMADCVDILEEVKNRAKGKLKHGYVIKPLTVTIVPDGTILVK